MHMIVSIHWLRCIWVLNQFHDEKILPCRSARLPYMWLHKAWRVEPTPLVCCIHVPRNGILSVAMPGEENIHMEVIECMVSYVLWFAQEWKTWVLWSPSILVLCPLNIWKSFTKLTMLFIASGQLFWRRLMWDTRLNKIFKKGKLCICIHFSNVTLVYIFIYLFRSKLALLYQDKSHLHSHLHSCPYQTTFPNTFLLQAAGLAWSWPVCSRRRAVSLSVTTRSSLCMERSICQEDRAEWIHLSFLVDSFY